MFLVSLITLGFILTGCSILSPAPARFSEFAEIQIAGPGSYNIPQWSPDSRYLAFIHSAQFTNLVVYDSQNNSQWTIASDVFGGHFSWKPDGTISFLRYNPQHYVSPYPFILDLFQTDIYGNNTVQVASNLLAPGDYTWSSESELFVLLRDPDSLTFSRDVYVIDTNTRQVELFLEAESVGLEDMSMLALSPKGDAILIFGINMELAPVVGYIVVFGLETQTIMERFSPSQIISPLPDDPALLPAISHGTNFTWVAGDQWFLAAINAPTGPCYNYALYFFDLTNLQNSFCIPTIKGIIGDPTISPDSSKLSYITVADPGRMYVMIAAMPSDLVQRLRDEE